MNADQKVTQPSTSTPAPTPPDLQPFPQLDHPYTDIGGKCHFCVCPEAEHTDPYVVQPFITHVGGAPPLALILTRQRSPTELTRYRWYVLDSGGCVITNQPSEADAGIVAEYYAQGYKRGSIQARYGAMHSGEEHPYHAEQLRPQPGA